MVGRPCTTWALNVLGAGGLPVMKTATTRLMALFHTLVQLHTRAPPVAAIKPYSTCTRRHMPPFKQHEAGRLGA